MNGSHTSDEASEEWLGAQVFVVGLEVLLGGGHKLNGNKLEAGRIVSRCLSIKGEERLTRAARSGR